MLRVGTSGYHYNHWRGLFYPEELPKAQWFSHYARNFDTVEINNTFYQLPSASAFDSWRAQAPQGFCYAVKFNRYGSHFMRLKQPRATLAKFLGAAKHLGDSLGPILVQLPPHWRVDALRLNSFLAAASRSFRWAVEFRDPSWLCRDVFAIVERYHAALCVHDMIQNHPRILTADWTYLRYHGEHYSGSYSQQKLGAEATWIQRQLTAGLDVFVYFNNDAQGCAVKNAADLRRYIKGRQPSG